MTLDEAIGKYEKISKHDAEMANRRRNHGGSYYEELTKLFDESAEEHRQLAEWLKELKWYREILRTYDCAWK